VGGVSAPRSEVSEQTVEAGDQPLAWEVRTLSLGEIGLIEEGALQVSFLDERAYGSAAQTVVGSPVLPE